MVHSKLKRQNSKTFKDLKLQFSSTKSIDKKTYLLPPLIQLGGLGGRYKLPHRVWAKPGHQMHFGAFRGENEAFQGTDFLYF